MISFSKYKLKAVKITYFGILASLFFAMVLSSCKVNYSFTGASIPPEVKSINIKYFPNNAALIEPTLSQKLTDALRDKFTNETSLIIVNNGGDLVLEGSIIGYNTRPLALQGDDLAAMNRLTIKLDVTYTNTFDDNMSFETTFERYEQYSSDQNLSDVQDLLIDQINLMLIEDIFNKAVVNW
jgi:hypothetical protein